MIYKKALFVPPPSPGLNLPAKQPIVIQHGACWQSSVKGFVLTSASLIILLMKLTSLIYLCVVCLLFYRQYASAVNSQSHFRSSSLCIMYLPLHCGMLCGISVYTHCFQKDITKEPG